MRREERKTELPARSVEAIAKGMMGWKVERMEDRGRGEEGRRIAWRLSRPARFPPLAALGVFLSMRRPSLPNPIPCSLSVPFFARPTAAASSTGCDHAGSLPICAVDQASSSSCKSSRRCRPSPWSAKHVPTAGRSDQPTLLSDFNVIFCSFPHRNLPFFTSLTPFLSPAVNSTS